MESCCDSVWIVVQSRYIHLTGRRGIHVAVRKTTLEIDDEVLAEVREILGTKGIKDTIDAALWRVRREALVKRHLDRMAELGPLLEDRDTAWHGRR